ncbi:hypothetical protein C900_03256 [Fulvivirga imtechensis AK7]|uniref:Yip1 domain-containing protein n=1 Tax=Fulvivirga imtechensis AK7 TaxID=1237149 RepID=L8JRY8_9BACT|nr:hypothetical protein [Fulvivirga imtechensis]ELR70973.1 hypothetical protein C900_03256 [Fulvivirga imtechensis AK7]
MKPFKTYFEDSSGWLVFTLVSCIYLFSTYIVNEFVLTESLYYNSLAEQLTYERINEMLESTSQWRLVQYAIIPITILVKVFVVTLCLNAGLLLTTYQVSFKDIFSIVLKAELIFAFASILNVVIFLLFFKANTFEDLYHLNSLSILSLLTISDIEPWLVYPLSIINIYELLYIAFLAIGLMIYINSDFKNSCKVVATSYGSALVFWLLFVVFIQINAY